MSRTHQSDTAIGDRIAWALRRGPLTVQRIADVLDVAKSYVQRTLWADERFERVDGRRVNQEWRLRVVETAENV
jgi:hypothetical protein